MIIAIHQPQFCPWLGFFDKMIQADGFCYLDNVQFKKNEWQNRNRIKTATGRQWLTVPVRHKFPQIINEVRINTDVNWQKKHLQTLVTNYRKAPYFADCIGFFEQLYSQSWKWLVDLNIHVITQFRKWLAIDHKPVVVASDLDLSHDPTDRLIDICRHMNADTYLSGRGGDNYLNEERFRQRGILLKFQEFHHPVYPQLYGSFISHLSIVDMLFNCGPEGLRQTLSS